jgi:hypothetical protein
MNLKPIYYIVVSVLPFISIAALVSNAIISNTNEQAKRNIFLDSRMTSCFPSTDCYELVHCSIGPDQLCKVLTNASRICTSADWATVNRNNCFSNMNVIFITLVFIHHLLKCLFCFINDIYNYTDYTIRLCSVFAAISNIITIILYIIVPYDGRVSPFHYILWTDLFLIMLALCLLEWRTRAIQTELN